MDPKTLLLGYSDPLGKGLSHTFESRLCSCTALDSTVLSPTGLALGTDAKDGDGCAVLSCLYAGSECRVSGSGFWGWGSLFLCVIVFVYSWFRS